MFNINVNALASAILTAFMRTANSLASLYTFLRGIKDLYNDFVAWSTEIKYELAIDYTVISLEKLLNDKFNGGMTSYSFDNTTYLYSPVVGAIYIIDAPDVLQSVFVWNKIENRPPLYLFNTAEAQPPIYLFNQAEYDTRINFIIMIPTALINIATNPAAVAQVKRWVNKYKIAGVNYTLQNY